MLKNTVESLDELPEALREHYTQDSNGRWLLETDEATGLKSALQHERERRRALQAENDQLRGKPPVKPESEMTAKEKFMAKAAQRLQGLQGDAYTAELVKLEAEMDDAIEAELTPKREAAAQNVAGLNQTIETETVRLAARELMRSIADGHNHEALEPHVINRLSAKRDAATGKTNISVLDKDGAPTSLTLDDLRDEFLHTPAFAPLIRGLSKTDQAEHARKVAMVLGQTHH